MLRTVGGGRWRWKRRRNQQQGQFQFEFPSLIQSIICPSICLPVHIGAVRCRVAVLGLARLSQPSSALSAVSDPSINQSIVPTTKLNLIRSSPDNRIFPSPSPSLQSSSSSSSSTSSSSSPNPRPQNSPSDSLQSTLASLGPGRCRVRTWFLQGV